MIPEGWMETCGGGAPHCRGLRAPDVEAYPDEQAALNTHKLG